MEIENSKSTGKRGRRTPSWHSVGSHSWSFEEVFVSASHSRSNSHAEEDEEALKWAAMEKLPEFDNIRSSVIEPCVPTQIKEKEEKIGDDLLIEKLFNVVEEDNGKLLKQIRDRYDKAKITLPTVEVLYEHLNIEADCFIGDRALPTLGNTVRNIAESALTFLGIRLSETTKLTILSDASGIIKLSRMTLLLGPPSSGKTTLLQALAGKLDPSLKVEGKVTYNGHTLNEFVPQRTCAYVSQHDVHVAEMTVKETLDFSARCQGTGSRNDLLAELERQEKEDGILPEPEVDLFMKV